MARNRVGRRVQRVATAGSLALATAWVLAGAPAGATQEICFEQTLESSPLTAASGEKLECSVVNDGGTDVAAQIRHIGRNGQELMAANRVIPPWGFRSSTAMVPFGGGQAYCEVRARTCIYVGAEAIAVKVLGLEVHGNLTRQDAATRDEAEAELVPGLTLVTLPRAGD